MHNISKTTRWNNKNAYIKRCV